MLSNDAILIQNSHNLGHLKEGNSEFSPRGDNRSGTKERSYLHELFCDNQLDMSCFLTFDSL